MKHDLLNRTLANEPPRIVHLHVNGGRVTVFARRTADLKENIIGLAFCSPTDRFKKALGRKIAEGRWKKNPYMIPFNGNTMRDVQLFLNHNGNYPICTDEWFPKWVEKKSAVTKSIRSLALSLLDDDEGISEDSWDELRTRLIEEGGNSDIINAVDGNDGRVYIPSDTIKECFPDYHQKVLNTIEA